MGKQAHLYHKGHKETTFFQYGQIACMPESC